MMCHCLLREKRREMLYISDLSTDFVGVLVAASTGLLAHALTFQADFQFQKQMMVEEVMWPVLIVLSQSLR